MNPDSDDQLHRTEAWSREEGETSRQQETPSDHPPAEEVPERIGRYRVQRRLGEGGNGSVYLARDEQLDRDVAVKVLHRRTLVNQNEVDQYLDEARVAARLDHAAIVPVFDAGQTAEGKCFIVSKLIDGSDLSTIMQEYRFPHRDAAELIATLAEALHYAHTRELVHRDVKPANVLVDSAGQVYLADFGLALRNRDYGTGPTYSGTPLYMSPEQARGDGHLVDGRTDIYSLGVVFYELLVGSRPFQGRSQEELMDRITRLDPRPPRQLDDSIPIQLERICLKALAREPAHRFSTARDFADELRAFLTDKPSPLAMPAAAPADAAIAKPPIVIEPEEATVWSGFRCRFCGCTQQPIVRQRVSMAGWITFGILIFACFLLSPFALFLREPYNVCAGCGQKLN